MTGKKKRVFIGIPIPLQLLKKISLWTDKNLDGYKLRKISGKNLHITLVPPWYVNNVDSVVEKLQAIKGKTRLFNLKFNEVSFGPDPKRPRLVWASGSRPDAILKLKKHLETMLNKKTEKREFKLHLTLARFRYEDYRNFPNKSLRSNVNWEMEVDNFCLYESILLRTGAEYKVLKLMSF